MNKPLKQKKCRSCKELFSPFNSMHIACSPDCTIQINRDKRAKAFNKETRKLKAKIKTKGKWIKEAQIEFNSFIRERDKGQPCISCQNPTPKKINAGHYKSIGGHPELRFCEEQVHLQCEYCNTHLSANLVNYRIHLIKKIGIERVEWIEGPHPAKRYTIDDIKEIKAEYNRKFKELKDE